MDQDRAVGALLGTFVGDALGMPYEGLPGEDIPERLEMVDARLGRGTYTDDTEMMIALAESLVRGDVVDERDLAKTFLERHDPRRGYGAGTSRVLELWRSGVDYDEAAGRAFEGRGSLGNGAAMRVAPVAVRFSDDEVVLAVQVRRSARLTHAHPEGVDGAVVQAAAVAAALEDQDVLQAAIAAACTPALHDRLQRLAARTTTTSLDPQALRTVATGVTSSAAGSVPAAVVAGARAESFEAAVTTAVRCGGDTDTVAAMAGAIAGARFGARAIPSAWSAALEDGERGRRHVEQLARDLRRRAASAIHIDHPLGAR